MVQAWRSRRVVTPAGVRDRAVIADGERIVRMVAPEEVGAGVAVEDLGEVALLPGLVDVHTHLNEPGRTEWEGFWTGTRAAAAGGWTTVVDMPLNNLPETTSVEALDTKRDAVRGKAWVDFALWGGAVNGNVADLEPMAAAGVAGFKCFLIYPGCDGFGEIDLAELERAAPVLTRTGLPLLVHAELAGPIEAATAALRAEGADWRRYATYLASRPEAAEMEAIERLIAMCRRWRFRLHVVHLSAAGALDMLRAAKAEGLPVTVETCPHYLHFAAEEIGDGATAWKCAPPIRGEANRERLWEGLLEGVIDLVGTDHSPCPPAMKRMEVGRFDEAWGGIASLAVALPAMWTECARRGVGLERLVQWMSAAPARLAGLEGEVGAIAEGRLASLVALDTEAEFTVRAEELVQRHPVSPYVGERLRGVVRGTWVRGKKVYWQKKFADAPVGREHRRMGDQR